MRKSILRFGWLTLALAVALLVNGCASMNSAPTLKLTRMNVDWPMAGYRDAVSAGRVTLGEQQAVNSAYAQYKAAFDAALQAASGNDKAHTPANVQQLADQVIQAVHAIPY
jgi:hypothetical protein